MKMENNTNLIQAEIERLGTQLDEYQIDLSHCYPEPRFTLYMHGIGAIPRGDIAAIKAKSKNGKSFLCSILISSMLGCGDFSLSCENDLQKILYFDTEQNERNTAKLAQRVHCLMGWPLDANNPRFSAFALRTADLPMRMETIKKAIAKHHPAAVFIDGVADLIVDFNNVEQSTQIINNLMELSATNDCAIVCVLHENKREDDKGMKGHLGTMLLQKSADVFQIKKDGYLFNVTETDCRNVPLEDFSFTVDGHGIPHPLATKTEARQTAKEKEIRTVMTEVFSNAVELGYNEIVEAYKLNACVEVATAKRRLKDAKTLGIIELIPESKKYRLIAT